MKTHILRLLMLTLAAAVLCTGAFALNYGEEWNGYQHSTTVSYTDVAVNHWAYPSIVRVSEKGWFQGYKNGSFRPNDIVTRAEAVTVFVKLMGLHVPAVSKTSFYDVSPADWYAPYIEAGKQLLPVRSNDSGAAFQPNMPITREDAVYALVIALGYSDPRVVDQSCLNMFRDKNSISVALRPYMAIALDNGIVSGFEDDTIRAQDPLSRACLTAILARGSYVGLGSHNLQPQIATVSVLPAGAVEMNVGEIIVFTARAIYTNGTSDDYTEGIAPYAVRGADVLTVRDCTIYAVRPGTAVIRFGDSRLQNETVTVTVKEPHSTPVISDLRYEQVTDQDTVTVSGHIADNSVRSVLVSAGGSMVNPNVSGRFLLPVALERGENRITIIARNRENLCSQQTIVIWRQ